jgi:hypothetical protein
MLQNPLGAISLRAPHQFFPVDENLVSRCSGEAAGGEGRTIVRMQIDRMFFQSGGNAQLLNTRTQTDADFIIDIAYILRKKSVLPGNDHRIRDFLGMQNSPASRRSSNHIDGVLSAPVYIDALHSLVVSQRYAEGLPEIHTHRGFAQL